MFKSKIHFRFGTIKSLGLKFILTVLPLFVVFSSFSLLLLKRYDAQGEVDRLSARVGNLTARVASALERNAAEQHPELAQDLMTALGSDTAVLCAELKKNDQVLVGVPKKIGCKGQVTKNQIELPIADKNPEIQLFVAYTFQEVENAVRLRFSITLVTLILGLIITLISSSIGFNKIVGRRLLLLGKAISQARNSGKRLEVPSGAKDQLGEIIDAYNEMIQWENHRENILLAENSNLEKKSKEEQSLRRHLEFQLETAQVFQKLVLPSPLFGNGFSSCFFYAPAERIGGDWFTFHIDEQQQFFYAVILDVTGHGVASALLASFLSGIVAAHFDEKSDAIEPSLNLRSIAEKVNRILFNSSTQSGMAATGLMLAIDRVRGQLFFINCGHPPILIKQEFEFEIIPSSGRRLGVFAKGVFDVQEMKICGNGRLFTYTDGLVDNCSDSGSKMSMKKLRKIMNETIEMTINEVNPFLQNYFSKNFKKSQDNDDATYIIIDWQKNQSTEPHNSFHA